VTQNSGYLNGAIECVTILWGGGLLALNN